jgi:hypothetical protein
MVLARLLALRIVLESPLLRRLGLIQIHVCLGQRVKPDSLAQASYSLAREYSGRMRGMRHAHSRV